MADDEPLRRAVARQVLLGVRESLTIAGRLGRRVEAVNAALERVRTDCGGCIALTRPYPGEARITVAVVSWEALRRAAGWSTG